MYIFKYIKAYTDNCKKRSFMQIGKLKRENEAMLERSTILGYSNKTKMIDEALDLLRSHIKKQERRKAKAEMMNQYAASKVDNYFESIDGDDFE